MQNDLQYCYNFLLEIFNFLIVKLTRCNDGIGLLLTLSRLVAIQVGGIELKL